MIVAETVPASGASIDSDSPEAADWLAARYAWPHGRWVRLNMITGLTGSAVGADGTSDTLTSRVDRRILGLIRSGADAVVVGAETVRVEGYTAPRGSVLVLVTASGDLTGTRLDTAPAGGVLVLCPGASESAVRARNPGLEVVAVGEGDRVDPPTALATLRDRGLDHIVCEGGPSLASEWTDGDLIDEWCVTVAPVLGAERPSFLRLADPPRTAVAGALATADGFGFLRLRRAS